MARHPQIVVRGAREHNLQNVDITLPRDALIVFTGVSGSGKSSLAFDTIFKEGQRRFMESLSAYARQFLGQMEKPRVDHIEGLSPTISIDQKTINRNPRSTVGTITEIYDHLRLLYARLGIPHCPDCGCEVASQTPEHITHTLYLEAEERAEREENLKGVRGMILAPIVQDRKGEYRKELGELLQEGFLRARIDGEVRDLREEISLDRYVRHTIEVVLDRVLFDRDSRSRITEAVEKAVEMSGGMVSALIDGQHLTFATERACPSCRISIPEMEPRVFSFNSPHGACPACDGLGQKAVFKPELLIPEPHRPLNDGAVVCLTKEGRVPFSQIDLENLISVAEHFGGSGRCPWNKLPLEARDALLNGTEEVQVLIEWGPRKGKTRGFPGVIAALNNAYKYTKADFLEAYRHKTQCQGCQGKRLSKVALAVTFRGQDIWTLATLSVEEAAGFFSTLEPDHREAVIGREIFKEIGTRLHFLNEVGLGYLNLNRSAASLAGGEAQRIRLASQVGSGLQGVLYVLDEPSIGLHPRDNQRLLGTLQKLRNLGNTVLVVEHDKETMEAADYLVDIGPGAGREGGKIMARGPVSRVRKGRSITARYLNGKDFIPTPTERRKGSGEVIHIRGAAQNNLKGIDVVFPLGTFIAVTGVSGSGKSTLVTDILHKVLARELHRAEVEPGVFGSLEGIDHLDKVIEIDQAPIGRTPRSNPATYTKVFDEIRGLFASLPEAKLRGYSKGRFSFNVVGGRCEECKGAGVKQIEMQFLANVEIPCEICASKRFNHETLTVKYKGKSINQVLEMTVLEASEFFKHIRKIRRTLATMVDVGLTYVQLGQPSTTLSGGEAQRVKLATELRRPATGRTLYILDEPTTGLHMEDVKKLLQSLQRLVDAGNTVIVIEHNLDVIKVADHVIDLGPEGGHGGGEVVATGTPEDIATHPTSHTGRFLKQELELEATLRVLHATGGDPATVLDRDLSRGKREIRKRPRNLTVKGAHKNNLRHVDVEIPKNKLTVITGVSGSGKTSLAFDTLFAEGQRRYVESLSTYARRFLGRLDKAPVDSVDGIAPSISVDQKAAPRNPRSTVATSTEINDYLRLLFARVGQPHCPSCGEVLIGHRPDSAAASIMALFLGQRGEILAELVDPDEAPPANTGEDDSESSTCELKTGPLLAQGFLRVRVDDQPIRLDQPESPTRLIGQRIELILDRVRVLPEEKGRLVEGFEAAFNHGEGIGVFRSEEGTRLGFSTIPGCLKCGFFLREALTPQQFSFNSHVGACCRCDGLGSTDTIDPERLIVDPKRPLMNGALHPYVAQQLERRGNRHINLSASVAHAEGFNGRRPWCSLSQKAKHLLLYGGRERFYPATKGRGRRDALKLKWRGVIPIVDAWYLEAAKNQDKLRDRLKTLMVERPCPRCEGARLKSLPLAVRIAGLNIHAVSCKTVVQALEFFRGLQFPPAQAHISDQILAEIISRLGFLRDVGLEYLSLDRGSSTLSGGEAQRIRLAGQLGSHLMGVLYVLDEPTIGLHPRDTERLLNTLLGLKERGNTVVVVEHDAQTILSADHLIDMGPGAGLHGGKVIAAGKPSQVMRNRHSVTGAYLSGRRFIPLPEARRIGDQGVRIVGAASHNLKHIDIHFPRGIFTCVTGVSGSGKSTLVMDVLAKALHRHFGVSSSPGKHEHLEVPKDIERVGVIDQSPLGRSPKSNPATYVGVLDPIRDLFASTTEARARGYTKGRFSFNLAQGRCGTCEGRGAIKFEMHFLSDVWVNCDRCKGKRYNEQTLQIKYRGRSIADVLEMHVAEAVVFFQNHRKIHRMIKPLMDVGLGYMKVGQPANTMSGGEAQRVKLASALMERARTGFYILDEPTTGLHFQDVEKLIYVLQRLVDRGNTVVVIEHNPDVVKSADWIIDLGPEGGECGGEVVGEGSPEQLATNSASHTGRFLKDLLSRTPRQRLGRPGHYAELLRDKEEESTHPEDLLNGASPNGELLNGAPPEQAEADGEKSGVGRAETLRRLMEETHL